MRPDEVRILSRAGVEGLSFCHVTRIGTGPVVGVEEGAAAFLRWLDAN